MRELHGFRGELWTVKCLQVALTGALMRVYQAGPVGGGVAVTKDVI